MKLTKLVAAPVWRAEVPPRARAAGTGAGTASQLPGVRRARRGVDVRQGREWLSVCVMAATLLSGGAYAQTPTELPVPEAILKDGRLTLPTGGEVSAPDPTWEWRILAIGEVKTFVLAKIGGSARILVM